MAHALQGISKHHKKPVEHKEAAYGKEVVDGPGNNISIDFLAQHKPNELLFEDKDDHPASSAIQKLNRRRAQYTLPYSIKAPRPIVLPHIRGDCHANAHTPDFPDTFKPLAATMAKALGKLRERSNVKWTYISPAGYFRAEGKRTGPYILGDEELTLADAGESVISYADYAIAMIDEIETGNHLQQRVSTERKQHNIVKCSSKSRDALPLDTASLTR